MFLVFSSLCLTKAPIVHDRISIWWKLKAGVAWLFHLRGVQDFSLSGILVSVGPVGHARLQWVMSSTVLASFGALYLFLFFNVYACVLGGDSFTPSVNLIHQPGSRMTPKNHSPFSVTFSISHKKWGAFTSFDYNLQKVGRKKTVDLNLINSFKIHS